MRRATPFLGAAAATAAVFLAPLGEGTARTPVASAAIQSATPLRQPLSFVENRGQADRRFAFYADWGGSSLFFTTGGVMLALDGWAVEQAFVGARAGAEPHASRLAPGRVNSFVGRRGAWKTGLGLYRRLAYRHVWPGIDVIYTGRDSGLETSFLIRPGADPRSIELAYRGATSLKLTPAGRLEVSTPAGRFVEQRPVAYQGVAGLRVPVRVSFRRSGQRRYGFRLGVHDTRRPVVIDPVVLGYAGFLGGSGDDQSFDTAVDGSGNAYMTGTTTSLDFPATPGPFSTARGNMDAFVGKVDRTGKLVYLDYIGGPGRQDGGRGIAVDGSGNAYIAGTTDSPQGSFPVTVGPDLTFNGGEEAFVAKVNRDGTQLLYSGYIGGDDDEGGRDVSVDANGYAYVAGTTSTVDSTFPAKVGPQLTYGGGNHDGFVAKVDPTGTGLVYCSYIGGTGDEDNVRGTAPDSAGNLYITGHADSTEASFPVTVGPDLTWNGDQDGYVGKINPTGTAFMYLGYVGGSGREQPRRVAVDSGGHAYIAGSTDSPNFPATVGPDVTRNGNGRDAFVTKVSSGGASLAYSGFIGGTGDDQIYDLEVDPAGSAYVVGLTTSTQATFPAFGGPDVTYNGGQDAFVAKVNQAGTGLDYAGYIGGNGADVAQGVGVDTAGRAYVSGSTTSTEATFPTLGAPDASFNGGPNDIFLAQVAPIKGAHLKVTLGGAVHARAPFTVRVEMRDGSGNLVTGYNGPASWASVDGAISPGVPAPFQNGVSTTQATIGAPYASDRITVGSGGATGQSAPFNVLGPLDHFVFAGLPASVPAGQSFTVRVIAKDVLNDTISDYAAPATWFDRSGTLSPQSPGNFLDGVSTTTARVTVPYHDDRITFTSNSVTGSTVQFTVTP